MNKIIKSCAMRGRHPDNPAFRGRCFGKFLQRLEVGGACVTITTRYGAMCPTNLRRGHFPMTGVIIRYEKENNTTKRD